MNNGLKKSRDVPTTKGRAGAEEDLLKDQNLLETKGQRRSSMFPPQGGEQNNEAQDAAAQRQAATPEVAAAHATTAITGNAKSRVPNRPAPNSSTNLSP